MSNLSQIDREYLIFSDPDLLNKITRHVANGGSLIGLADVWQVKYSDLRSWVRSDTNRSAAYDKSLEDRKEWAREKILSLLHDISEFDIRSILNEQGGLKPVSEWSEVAGRVVAALEISEEYDGKGNERVQSGWLKRVKTKDSLKALEMLAKNLSMLTEKHEVNTQITLDQLIMAGRKPNDEK